MFKKNLTIALASGLFFVLLSCQNQSQNEAEKPSEAQSASEQQPEREKVVTPRFPSPAAGIVQTIGRSTIKIDYSRPSVISQEGMDRTDRIWGGLVPYDFNFRPSMGGGQPRPWRAGANENTIIEFSDDALIEGQPIKAGKYGLHMAVHEGGGATVIFSNNSDAWGSFSYNEADDALRVEVKTSEIPLTERLIYTIGDIDKTSGIVSLDWEKKRISFKVAFDTHGMVIANFRDYLSDTTGLHWSDYNTAANYCAQNDVNLEEGLVWIEQSLVMEENFRNLSTKALILSKNGDVEEADKTMDRALNHESTTANNYYSYGTQLIRQGNPEEAMEIYQQLAEKWPDHWLTAHGLARGYSARGNYDEAINFEKDALSKAPDANKGFIEWAISKLEQRIDFN